MATEAAKRYGIVWEFVVRGVESRARAKTELNLKASKRARLTNFTGVFTGATRAPPTLGEWIQFGLQSTM